MVINVSLSWNIVILAEQIDYINFNAMLLPSYQLVAYWSTFLTFFCFVEKTYWLHFFEVGSHNDLLYKLYAVMCDVFVVVVDSTNSMASQDAVLMLDKIRSLSPDNGRTSR